MFYNDDDHSRFVLGDDGGVLPIGVLILFIIIGIGVVWWFK